MKKIFIDVETTGTNSFKNDLVQVAAIIEINGVVKDTIDILSRPTQPENIELEALQVIKKTKKELMSYPPHNESFNLFKKKLGNWVDPFNRKDKYFFIGYNARFDEKFIRSWFYKSGDKFFGSWFHWPAIDISNVCAWYLEEQKPTMRNFKLMTVAKELGVEVEEEQAHDAMYDIEITREMYHKLNPLLSQRGGKDQV